MAELAASVRDFDAGYRGAPVVVLGAAGFIGRWVARGLTAAGAAVTLVVRDRTAAQGVFDRFDVGGTIAELDLADERALGALLGRVRPAVVFNLAGYGVDRTEVDVDTAYHINAGVVGRLCAAMVSCGDPDWPGQAVVHAGTAMEYGGVEGDLDEAGPAQPTTLYGRSKLEGTRALTTCVEQRGLKGLTARLFAVYGPGEAPERLLPTLLHAAAGRQPIGLTAGAHARDFVYVEEVAEALLRLGLAAERTATPVNVATGALTSIRAFVETAAAVLEIDQARLRFGALPTRLEEMRHAPVTNARLQRLTGWAPATSIAEGIRRATRFAGRPALPVAHHGP